MSRKHRHEDHQNHEAWAIPYGDLVTLLLAFFVVMYSISSVNEGKYRVVSHALNQAFGGPPKSINPIQVGTPAPAEPSNALVNITPPVHDKPLQLEKTRSTDEASLESGKKNLDQIGARIVDAMKDLIDADLIEVKRSPLMLEVELKSDIFFASGSALPNTTAIDTMERLAGSLAPFPNPIRIEGHTDNVPISTLQFPSNWELSAARAASVVHGFMANGVDPRRLTVVGYSDQVPKESNVSAAGRSANRRVLLVILAAPEAPPAPGQAPDALQSEAGAAAVPEQAPGPSEDG